MKVIAGELPLDDGRLVLQQDLKVTRLEQDPPRRASSPCLTTPPKGWPG